MKLFADNSDYFGICVHGCNHSGNEFGITNYEEIESLSSTALWRMEQHKKLTGLPFDPVFVFPQGKFSSTTIKVLKEQGYFAAFNSGLKATDYEKMPALENESAATTIYHDFPLFLRYYPESRTKFFQSMKSGRPILIAEHHTAFRNGFQYITDTVDWINSLGNIRWTSLLNIAEHYLGKRYENSFKLPDNPPLRTNTSTLYARRILSEIRDNYIETNSIIAKLYKNIRSHLSALTRIISRITSE